MVISKERWQDAQEAEKGFHKYDMEEGLRIYGYSYSHHFKYLEIPEDLAGKKIIEIGCAGFPALHFRTNYNGIIIEPLYIDTLDEICKKDNLKWIQQPVEEIDIEPCDEIWIFNVMQHIIDPDLFVEKCKAAAKEIKYFEPIDYPTCEYHPHTFSIEDFKRWFGNPKEYSDFDPHFHDAICAYGIWSKYQ